MSYGLLSTGFVPKTLEVIRAEINQKFSDTFGSSFDLTDGAPLGKWIGILAEREALLWQLAQAIAASQDPDQAVGAQLEAIAALTGTFREAASSSIVTLTLTGVATTTVAAASQASNQVTGERFTTSAAATLVTLTAWASGTAYAVGDRVTNSGNAYLCTAAGTSAGSGGPTTEADAITDNTVTWRYLGEGVAAVDVAATSVNTGAIAGASGDLNIIETPVAGWSDVINILDAALGTSIETDEALRLRREAEIAVAGATTIDATRARLLQVEDVTTVKGFWNNSDTVDSDGVPPKAVEFLIQGGADQDIWDTLLANVAGGIETHGDEIGTSTDSENNSYIMAFSRPTEIEIYHELVIEYDATLYPSDGDDQVKAAIVAYGDAQVTGRDATPRAATAAAMSVTGVIDVTTSEVGTTALGVSDSPVVITSRQLAVYDTSRIALTSGAATP